MKFNRKHTEETKQKMSEARKGQYHSEETKQKIREARLGEKHPMFGKHCSEETKQKISAAISGEKNGSWKGGKSYEPYSLEWNNKLKEQIRNRDDRLCQMPKCYLSENGRKHDVHHVDYDKKHNNSINLITLCASHNSKVNINREYWTELFQELQLLRGL